MQPDDAQNYPAREAEERLTAAPVVHAVVPVLRCWRAALLSAFWCGAGQF